MSSVVISGDISGSVTLDAPSVAGTTVLTLPATSGTVLTQNPSAPANSLVVDASGNVGIGTTSPSSYGKLAVSGVLGISNAGASGYAWRYFRNTSTPTAYCYDDGTNIQLTVQTAGALQLATNDTERMRITSAGGVSFGSSGTAFGTTGQVLQSNGDAAPTWVAPSGMTLLATIATTSGTSVNSGTVNLTSYKQVQIVVNAVSNSGTTGNFTLTDPNATAIVITQNPGSAGNGITAIFTIDLATGILAGTTKHNTTTTLPDVSNGGVGNNPLVGKTTFSTASTIFTFNTTVGAFDAGSILIYGVR